MTSASVSVVMPFRDTDEYLSDALDSLVRQTMADFEVLLINDNSTDMSLAIAEEYTRRDSRFRILHSPGGFVPALNLGLAQAEGEWVARMDSDDVCHPERLRLQLETARISGEKCVVSCRIRSFPDALVTEGYRRYEQWINSVCSPQEIEHNLFVESPVPHPTAFFHKQAVLEQGGYLNSDLPEDYELWLRLWSRGFSFRRVPKTLLGWRERGDRLSRTSSRYSLSAFYRTKAMYLEHVPCLSGKKVFIAGTGQCARRLSQHIVRSGFTVTGFLSPHVQPPKSQMRGVPVLSIGSWHVSDSHPVLIASREPGAREKIKAYMEGLGLENWKGFVLCS